VSQRRGRIESEWEATALQLWESIGSPPPPIDPYKLCAELDLRVAVAREDYSGFGSFLMPHERIVYVDRALSDAQRAFAIAHEAVHSLLPCEKSERCISYVTMAVLLPHAYADAAIERTWDIIELGDELAPHLSPEVLSRRLLSLRSNVAVSVWKEARPIAALRSPALRHGRPTQQEHDMAMSLFAERERWRVDLSARMYAVADDTAAGRFVITVGELDRLSEASENGVIAEARE
jgi:hypothetical protein